MHRLTDTMHRLAEWVQHFAEQLGGPGLAIIAFFDSSFLTLPEVADFLVAVFTIREPNHWYYFAAMTTLGSVAGCYALYLVGRKGGEALLRRQFHERHIDRGLAWFGRYGALVLIVPALLPPPMPFKIFVLLAGVSGVPAGRFITAVALARGIRYGGVAILARWYGEKAVRFIEENTWQVFAPALGLLAVAGVIWWLVRRRAARSAANRPGAEAAPKFRGSADVE